MKKYFVSILTSIIMVSLIGCSSINARLEARIAEHSGIKEDTNYKRYSDYAENGKLDKDGYYIDDDEVTREVTEETQKDIVQVSFSENAYLDVEYYLDSSFTNRIDQNECKLSSGDALYAQVLVNNDAPSSAYTFEGFRILEVDQDGDWQQVETVPLREDGLVLSIKDEVIGKQLAIEPLGKYEARELSLTDSYVDANEQEHPLSGKWIVNDKPVSDNRVSINPVSTYIISYEFDSNNYFYLSSEPECFYSNNEDGIVIFRKREATDDVTNYSVKLHSYINVSIPSAKNRHVSINNGPKQEVGAGKDLSVQKLKYGDSIKLVTDVEWSELDNYKDLVLQSAEGPIPENGHSKEYKYILTVPEKGSEFEFDPSEYSYEHGTIRFKYLGEEVTSVKYPERERKIYYEEASAEDGYWLPEGENYVIVTTPEETRRQLEAIQFVEKTRVTVKLKQPECGGRIEYFANGMLINADEYKSDSGTEIQMKFFPWEGWITNYHNGEKYVVTAAETQQIKVNGKDISKTAFVESEEHKPTLEVVLLESVGENMKFSVQAPGLPDQNGKDHYVDRWLSNQYTLIEPTAIGTEKGISISMSDRAIQTGTAVKILVEMTGEDKSGTKAQKVNTSFYRLIDNLADLQQPIDIYERESMGSSSVWYKTIKITIGVVDVVKYKQPILLKNESLSIRNADTAVMIKDGDILENDEKVIVTISADDGYYVTGTSVKNGIYQSTITFEKCVSTIQDIIYQHPIGEYILINLSTEDEYGTCTFKVNGNKVSGSVNVKNGDTVTLEYTTKAGYIIEGATGRFGFSIGKNDKTVTKTISIDSLMEGDTLNRNTFGIEVKEES